MFAISTSHHPLATVPEITVCSFLTICYSGTVQVCTVHIQLCYCYLSYIQSSYSSLNKSPPIGKPLLTSVFLLKCFLLVYIFVHQIQTPCPHFKVLYLSVELRTYISDTHPSWELSCLLSPFIILTYFCFEHPLTLWQQILHHKLPSGVFVLHISVHHTLSFLIRLSSLLNTISNTLTA